MSASAAPLLMTLIVGARRSSRPSTSKNSSAWPVLAKMALASAAA